MIKIECNTDAGMSCFNNYCNEQITPVVTYEEWLKSHGGKITRDDDVMWVVFENDENYFSFKLKCLV